MKNSILILFILLFSVSFSAQEILKSAPKSLFESRNTSNDQKLMLEMLNKTAAEQNFSNIIPIPTANFKNPELYTIHEAPLNNKYNYKILNMFPKKLELKESILFKK